MKRYEIIAPDVVVSRAQLHSDNQAAPVEAMVIMARGVLVANQADVEVYLALPVSAFEKLPLHIQQVLEEANAGDHT